MGMTLIGLCIGSFLNVVIYRVPRGLSVNDPKRSYCPHCQITLPIWQNIPVVTWLLQRGKCRNCQAGIPIRYLAVEMLTGLAFFLAWMTFPFGKAIFALVLLTVLLVVSFIDAEHQLIPIKWTGWGAALAVGGSLFWPGFAGNFDASILGWAVGFSVLWIVIQLGKKAFGTKKMSFEKPESWRLQEGYQEDPQLHLIVGEEALSWDDLFYRDSDRLELRGHGIKKDGKATQAKMMTLRRESVTLDGHCYQIEDLQSLTGKAEEVVIPREAMGSGDPHLLSMIGAFLGWQAVLFTVFFSSLYAIAAAVLGRVGFGKPLPYGPFLAAAAVTWLFGGWRWWAWYVEQLGL